MARDGEGRPLAFTLTAGNVNDCTQFEQVMARIRIQRCGPGRPRTRPERVAADKGYSSTKIRTYLRRRGIKAAIPEVEREGHKTYTLPTRNQADGDVNAGQARNEIEES